MSSQPEGPTTAVMIEAVREQFLALQTAVCDMILKFARLSDPTASFVGEALDTAGGGLARPRVITTPWDGSFQQCGIEKAAVQFTHSIGAALPRAATERNPALAGEPFQAVAVSVIVHPHNPFVPTCHMNVRFFVVEAAAPVWYFGGGYDLTPYYGFVEDVQHWHKVARDAVGAEAYPAMKQRCDEYFFLPHRSEPRGVGGIFFDDWTTGGFAVAAALVGRVGSSLVDAYAPIFEGRTNTAYGPEQRDFQAYRRGRYAEFNLAIDRGTRYGLQSGRRVESVLASLPPEARWLYDYSPAPGSAEAALTAEFLPPRDWLESCG